MLNAQQRREVGRAVLMYDLLTLAVAGTIVLPYCCNKEETAESAGEEEEINPKEERNLEQVLLHNFPYPHEQELRESAAKNCLEEVWVYDGREWYNVTAYANEVFAIVDKKKVEEIMQKNKRGTTYMYHTHPATAWEVFPPSDTDLLTHEKWKKEAQEKYGFIVSRIVDPLGVWEYDTRGEASEAPTIKILFERIMDRRENPYSMLAEPLEQAIMNTVFEPRETRVEAVQRIYKTAGVSVKFTQYEATNELNIKIE